MPVFRSVVAHKIQENLEIFFREGKFDIFHYHNMNKNHSSDLFMIIPFAKSGYSIASSGVTSNDNIPSTALGSLIVINSHKKGWHMYGGDQNDIEHKVKRGELVLIGKL